MLARHRRRGNPRGFTLVEMMVAMVLTLLMVWAIAEFYARVGESVKDGRAMIEQRSSLRSATQRLIDDLKLITVVPAPPINDAVSAGYTVGGAGYLEIVEGGCSDADPDGNFLIDTDGDGEPDLAEDGTANGVPDFNDNTLSSNFLGDIDDYWAATIRSQNEPFTAQVVTLNLSTGIMSGTGAGTSNLAEVAWWTSFKDDPLLTGSLGAWEPAEPRALHRRLLLIRPEVNLTHSGDTDYSGPYYFRLPAASPLGADYYSVMQFCDVSVRPLGTINGYVYYFANSLSDLTRREYRFMHVQGGATAFPNALDLLPNNGGNSALARGNVVNDFSQYRWILGGTRRGEDVILSNLLAFDVRVFDATAVLRANNTAGASATATLQPGDPGYALAITNNHPIAGYGAYVDLWYRRYTPVAFPATYFSDAPQARSGLGAFGVYCTWAASYERDGLDQDSSGTPDQGTDGLDSDTFNGVDDKGEQETLPPYTTRLRGLEVKVRNYDPGTRQVSQGTVGADFIPE